MSEPPTDSPNPTEIENPIDAQSASEAQEPASEPPEGRDDSLTHEDPPRREFFSVVIGGACVAVPALAGLRVVASPLFSERDGGVVVRLTSLESLVPGGPPQAFKVVADKTDAWTTYKNLPQGIVYVQRSKDGELLVFSASCPHAGCMVEYREGQSEGENLSEHYYCPCHKSSFGLDGEIAGSGSPAKRGLDSLEVDAEKLARGEVWVRFQKFKAGVVEKKVIS